MNGGIRKNLIWKGDLNDLRMITRAAEVPRGHARHQQTMGFRGQKVVEAIGTYQLY